MCVCTLSPWFIFMYLGYLYIVHREGMYTLFLWLYNILCWECWNWYPVGQRSYYSLNHFIIFTGKNNLCHSPGLSDPLLSRFFFLVVIVLLILSFLNCMEVDCFYLFHAPCSFLSENYAQVLSVLCWCISSFPAHSNFYLITAYQTVQGQACAHWHSLIALCPLPLNNN